ncbi:metal-dependent phosphohydrolase [Thauera sinica]|nr:metal-dependent phosphohydrolase [Thauera sp. K11]
MMTPVSTRDLKVGMFVAELDRPWLETPFLLQGFLIEEQSQIEHLQALCQTVQIDRGKSVGDFFTARVHEKDAPLAGLPRPEKRDPPDFVRIARAVRRGGTGRRSRMPSVRSRDELSLLEEELLYSAPVIEDVQTSLRALTASVQADTALDLSEVSKNVAEVAEGVARNPEAMLWLARLKSTDEYSYDHALDVSVHLMVFARFLGLPREQVEALGVAGLVQDLGKTQLPREILAKPGPLTPEELRQARYHVVNSLRIVASKPGLHPDTLEIIGRHHERIDGSGYPLRLKGPDIGLLPELAGLMDTYCAMIRERSYRRPLSSQQAIAELIRLRGDKFRDTLVDQFVQCMGLYPIGTLVELNSGEVAVVLQQNQIRRLQPKVMVLLAPDKSVERYPRTLDLMLEPVGPTGEPYRILGALPDDAYGIDPAEFYLA